MTEIITGLLHRIREPLRVFRVRATGEIRAQAGPEGPMETGQDEVGLLPPLYPEWLGDRGFAEAHRLRFPYVTGSMANGIASPALVTAVGRAGMLGFVGAAGLEAHRVEADLDALERAASGCPFAWGANLIHSPSEPGLEERIADLYVRRGVTHVEASAYMGLTPAVVRVAAAGLRVDTDARIRRRCHLFAKVSRPEVARQFMSPAPATLLDGLRQRGLLTEDEVQLARQVPLASDITVEADSGGHTDNRPLTALMPAMLALRDEAEAAQGQPGTIRVGAAGGLGTSGAVAAAFALGAAYVVTGSVNQAAVESGLSDEGREMLAAAELSDVAMAAAADMFELGVKLQVLTRGTLFATRANKLYDVYREHPSIEALPAELRAELERLIFGRSLDAVWLETKSFWDAREPEQARRAEMDPKHKMALVFRWYLGRSSRWAIAGEKARRLDYQIWCGPAMGAFNDWARGSFLEAPSARGVVEIALNLLEGAAVITRAQQLRTFGMSVPAAAFQFRPRPLTAAAGSDVKR